MNLTGFREKKNELIVTSHIFLSGHRLTQDYQISVRESFIKMKSVCGFIYFINISAFNITNFL